MTTINMWTSILMGIFWSVTAAKLLLEKDRKFAYVAVFWTGWFVVYGVERLISVFA